MSEEKFESASVQWSRVREVKYLRVGGFEYYSTVVHSSTFASPKSMLSQPKFGSNVGSVTVLTERDINVRPSTVESPSPAGA